MSSYQQLLIQIEAFVKRFYINRIVKGLLFFVGIFLLALLFFSGLEFLGRFNQLVRGIFFFSLVGLTLFLLYRYIVDPILKLNKIGKRLSPIQASELIGNLIPSISDRVLNTLQLEQNTSAENIDLIRAAIEQKSLALNQVSFTNAIPLKDNKKYAKFVLPVVFVFLLILFINPSIIGSGTIRLINYNHVFTTPAPFVFIWSNPTDQLEEGKDLSLSLKLEGKSFPEKVYVVSNRGKFLLNKTGKNTFDYAFHDVHESLNFYFAGGEFNSSEYSVDVFGSSRLGEIKAELDYPNYTGKKDEIRINPIVMSLPEGTNIKFIVNSKNTSYSKWIFSDTTIAFKNELYDFNYKALFAQNVVVKIQNEFTGRWKSEQRIIQTVADAYPQIDVKETIDTANVFLRYFNGFTSDDYGVSMVYFISQITRNHKPLKPAKTKVEGVVKSGGNFYHYVDVAQLNLKAGDVLSYYFTVYDNDGIHGSKSSSSQHFLYKVPNKNELEKQRENAVSNALSGVSEVQNELFSFRKKMEELRKSNLNNDNLFKKKELIQDLQKQRKSLEEKLKKLSKKLNQTMKEKSLFDKVSPKLLKQQEMLKKMLNEVMDEELKKLLDELSKMLQKNQKTQFEKKMEQMKLTNDELSRKMDRAMEMLKKMQIDEKLDDAISKLNKLSEEQKTLKNKVKQGLNDEKAKSKQEALNSAFDEVQKKLDTIAKLNEKLARPAELDMKKNLQQSINGEMQKATENLEKSKQNKAGDNQQKAAEQMEQLSQSLQKQKEQNQQQQQGEDMKTIRSILQNLLSLSFDEEALSSGLQDVIAGAPASSRLALKQKRLMEDYVVVKDSLIALSNRAPQTAKYIDKNLGIIDRNYATIMDAWNDVNYRSFDTKLRLTLTAYNDLALMLNESLKQMQSNMRAKSGGKGSCNKPGGKSPKPSPGESLQNMKEALKKQLGQMKNGVKEGQKSGQGKKGNNGLLPGGMSNKQIAKMAAEQSAIRQALEKLKQELNADGQGLGNALNPLLKELEQQEKDLVNKRFNHLVERQQKILTRMLESEKALKERQFDNKRESKEGKNVKNSNLIEFLEYKKKKQAEIEQLRLKTPALNQYYKQRADAYFNNLRKND